MAPLTNGGSRFLTDDFIPTISDDEADIPDFDEDEEIPTAPAVAEATALLKRKRDADAEDVKESKKGKKKRRKSVEVVEEVEEPQEEDGDFDPEFQFDLGNINQGYLELVNGSGSGEVERSSIDAIIARRREKQKAEAVDEDDTTIVEGAEEDDGSDSGDEEAFEGLDGEEDDNEEEDGASVDSDDEVVEDSQTIGLTNGHDNDGNDDDEDDEVAEHVPHPDDDLPFQDGASDVEEEEEDPEVKKRRDAFFASGEADTVGQPISTTGASFQSMQLSRHIQRGLAASGFVSPTPIQAKAIPVALMGKDIVGGAVTGSGKTAAFLIPILERLLYRDRKLPTTRVGVLLPTRELAVQCHKVALKLASSVPGLSIALIVGGLSVREQEQTLKQRPDIVIATPGRFIDHMRNTAAFAVENLEILVLDEADRMLEDGFADELNEILTTIPKSRQTMLFSATMTEDVDQLIRVGLNRPVRLMVDSKKQTVSGLVQEFIKMKGGRADIDEERRLAYLLHLCMNIYTNKVIVFCPRKTLAHRLKILFSLHDVKAAELHGSMSQEQRLRAITDFQSGACTHLLATDLASRGLDIPRVETVINFTVPTTTTTYLHRVGRTARAGLTGVACTLFSPTKSAGEGKGKGSASERTLLRPILKVAKNQKATIRTRTLPATIIDDLTSKVKALDDEIEAILKEEKEERLLQQTERDMTKGENLMKHEEEIMSRPRRTWFQSEKEKLASSKLGIEERTGGDAPKKHKKKLSGKEKKQLLNRDERTGGKAVGWKKGKDERAGKGVLEKEKGKKKGGNAPEKDKGKRPSRPTKARANGGPMVRR